LNLQRAIGVNRQRGASRHRHAEPISTEGRCAIAGKNDQHAPEAQTNARPQALSAEEQPTKASAPAPATISLFGRRLRLPSHPILRVGLGLALVIGGVLGFLPVLGFWMVPLGIAVLAVDIPAARRLWRHLRRAGIRLLRRLRTLRGR